MLDGVKWLVTHACVLHGLPGSKRPSAGACRAAALHRVADSLHVSCRTGMPVLHACMLVSCMPVLQAATRYLRMQSSSSGTSGLCGPACVLQPNAGACRAAGCTGLQCSLHVSCTPVLQAVTETCACRAAGHARQPCGLAPALQLSAGACRAAGCSLHVSCMPVLQAATSTGACRAEVMHCSPVCACMCPATQCWCMRSSCAQQIHPATDMHLLAVFNLPSRQASDCAEGSRLFVLPRRSLRALGL